MEKVGTHFETCRESVIAMQFVVEVFHDHLEMIEPVVTFDQDTGELVNLNPSIVKPECLTKLVEAAINFRDKNMLNVVAAVLATTRPSPY